MVKTKLMIKKGSWNEVLNDCRFTANKNDIDKEPSDAFKEKVLIAEHSPIRDLSWKWEWHLPHWTVGHWVRHKWEKFVQTQRTDRTGVDRHTLAQDVEQGMRGEANTQNLIDSMRKRLCFKASPETRESAESLKIELYNNEETGDKFVANVLVPNCIYRCGCCEHSKDDDNRCKFFDNFVKSFPEDKDIFSIRDRYNVYNKNFYKNHATSLT